MPTLNDLHLLLDRLDGRGYKAYKEIAGRYEAEGHWTLHIDHVQGDPFASPSKIRLRVEQSVAKFPGSLFDNRVRRVALEDYLTRQVHRAIRTASRGQRGTGKSGLITVDAGGQEVLERTSMRVTADWVEARVEVGLPARGRTILGRQAETMLCQELPRIVQASLAWSQIPQDECRRFVDCVENQEQIRARLDELGLVGFVGDGSLLPRESGASDRPMSPADVIPFRSPETLRVEVELLHPVEGADGPVTSLVGMGIPRGVTLIVGGGYHGKSTLLNAIERAVYPHVPGDGREYVVTLSDAVKIRAEDRRRVEQVNISPFIDHLPFGRSTSAFSTDDASGSTSQAANIMEALEMGARVLLLDEDTSATNFMVRDARMQALVHKDNEPITPFLDRVRQLCHEQDVSTVLVMGGSGDYFDVADTIVMMKDYLPHDVSEEARRIAREQPSRRSAESGSPLPASIERVPLAKSFDPSRGRREVKIDAKSVDLIVFGREPIDLRGLEQLVDPSQTRAIGYAIHWAASQLMHGERTLGEVMRAVDDAFDREGLDVLAPFQRREHHPGNFARPRRYEIAAAINRLRTVRMRLGDRAR